MRNYTVINLLRNEEENKWKGTKYFAVLNEVGVLR